VDSIDGVSLQDAPLSLSLGGDGGEDLSLELFKILYVGFYVGIDKFIIHWGAGTLMTTVTNSWCDWAPYRVLRYPSRMLRYRYRTTVTH
jgi:hypothetical protein